MQVELYVTIVRKECELRYQFRSVENDVATMAIERTGKTLAHDGKRLQLFETRKGFRNVEHGSVRTCLVPKVGR